MTRAQEIAEGLGEAQRAAVTKLDARLRLPREIGAHTNALIPLMDLWRSKRGVAPPLALVRRDYRDWPRLAWVYGLTPLGLEVRAILQETDRG